MREALFDNVRCNTSGSVRVENVERRVERYVERYDVHLISFIRRDSNIPVKYVIYYFYLMDFQFVICYLCINSTPVLSAGCF